jgi:hypothetical protein
VESSWRCPEGLRLSGGIPCLIKATSAVSAAKRVSTLGPKVIFTNEDDYRPKKAEFSAIILSKLWVR